MRIQRVLSMSREELLFRSRQKWAITLERFTQGALTPAPGESGIADSERLQGFRRLAPSRFFAGASDSRIPELLLCRNPHERQQCLDCAEAICKGEFPILGYGMLAFGPVGGDAPDWHLDPISGRQSPRIHWSRVDPLDVSRVGDSKVTWEIGRHQWLLDLGQAYQYTGDERYASRAFELLESWMEENPEGIGIHWNSSLEIAYRLISWCWALMLFLRSQALTPALFVKLESWVYRQALHVERYLSRYFSPNTHLTGEALGLFYIATLFPDMKGAAGWRSEAQAILEQQLQRQVFKDGVYFEQSTCYQAYTVEIYLHFLILAERNGIEVPAWVSERLQAMVDFLGDIRQPDGTVPAIGDADGGRLLPLLRRLPGDCQGLFSVAAAWFRRDDYAWLAGGPTPEALRLLGRSRRYLFLSLRQFTPINHRLAVYPDGGYAIVRNHWRRNANHLIFDVGPLGCPDSGAHGHADLLSIQCSAFGEPCLVDSGTGCYTNDPATRDHFRSSHAHNTATVDNRSQAEPAGAFSWKGHRPAAALTRHRVERDTVLLEGVHHAWMNFRDPVEHRRRVLFIRNEYWVIVDDFHGAASHKLAIRYQFAKLPVSLGNDHWVRARCRNGAGFSLRTLSAAPIAQRLFSGDRDPMQGWISPDYGQCVSAPVLISSVETRLPVRIVSLLYPQRDRGLPVPTVSLSGGHDMSQLLVEGEHEDRIAITATDMILQSEVAPCAE